MAAFALLALAGCAAWAPAPGLIEARQTWVLPGSGADTPSPLTLHWTGPPTPAAGLVWLQHGFTRRCDHLTGTRRHLARAGLWTLCVDSPDAAGRAGLPEAMAQALVDGLLVPPGTAELPVRWVVAGHSAGAQFAARAGRHLAQVAPGRLAGALLLDPVAGSGFASDLAAIAAGGMRPVWAITAPAGRCNRPAQTLPILLAVAPGFAGVQLTGASTHLDAEGEDAGALAAAACGQGAPTADHAAYLRGLSEEWALTMLSAEAGSATPGPLTRRLLGSGRARALSPP